MFLDGNTAAEAIIVLPMDEIHSSASISVVKNDYPVKITNGAALDEFALKLMESESMGINIEGKTKVHIGKLAAKVTYREAITMTGIYSHARRYQCVC